MLVTYAIISYKNTEIIRASAISFEIEVYSNAFCSRLNIFEIVLKNNDEIGLTPKIYVYSEV